MKAFRWMNILNGLCTIMLLTSIMCSIVGAELADVGWRNAAGRLMICPVVLPFGLVSWLVALICWIRCGEKEEFREKIGRRGKWLVIWPVVQVFLFAAALLVLAGSSGL